MNLKRQLCKDLLIADTVAVTDQRNLSGSLSYPNLLVKFTAGSEAFVDLRVTVRPDAIDLTATDWFELHAFINAGVNPDDPFVLRLSTTDALLCIPLPLNSAMGLRLTVQGDTSGGTPGKISAWLIDG